MKSFPFVPQHAVVDAPGNPDSGYYRIHKKSNGSIYHLDDAGSSKALIQEGGNTIAATVTVGTNDNNNLEFKTNGIVRFAILASGVGNYKNNFNVGSATDYTTLTTTQFVITVAGAPYFEVNPNGFKRYGSDGFSINTIIASGALGSNKSQVIPNKSGTYVLDVDLAAYALDSAVVHRAGSETVTGSKTFNANIIMGADIVPDANNSRNIGQAGTIWSTIRGTTIYGTTFNVLDSDGITYKSALISTSTNVLRLGNGFATVIIPGILTTSSDATVFGVLSTGGTVDITSASTTKWVNGAGVTATGGSFFYRGVAFTSNINQTGGTGLIYGFYALPALTSITGTFYGYYSNISATPTGGGVTYAMYHSGTAPSYFGGSTTTIGAINATSVGILDTTYKTGLDLSSSGIVRLGQGFTALATGTSVTSIYTTSAGSFSWRMTGSQTGDTFTITRQANLTTTSSFSNQLSVYAVFAPTSGTGSLRGVYVSPTINQTSTANGQIDGFLYDPVNTSVLGTHYAYRSTSGNWMIGGTTTKMSAPVIEILDFDGVTMKQALSASGGTGVLLFAGGNTGVTTPVSTFQFTGGGTTISSSAGNLTLQATSAGNLLTFQSAGGGTTNNGVTVSTTTTMTNNSNNRNVFLVSGNYTISTGTTGTFQSVRVRPTFTVSSTATSIMALIELWPSVSSLTAGSTLYGLRSRIDTDVSGASTWNIFADGTAPNYMKGKLNIDDDIEFASGKSDIVKDTITGTRYRIVVTSGVVTAVLA